MDAHEPEPREKALLTHELLNKAYRWQELKNRRDHMHELISTMLSHRTNHKDEETAYRTMLERFGDWKGVMNADTDELADAVQTTRYPGQKAHQIQQTLRIIKEERGEFNIDFLEDLPIEEAMDWLTKLPGIGPKTASLLLLFNFYKPVMPVDTHVLRISQRVGLIGARVTANKAHDLLLQMLPREPEELYNFHMHMLRHGQRVCTFFAPKCHECVLHNICNYYQDVRAKGIDKAA